MSREKQQQLSQAAGFITGMPKYCAKTSFTVNGETYTSSQVVQVCKALLSADDATVQAKAAYSEAVAAERKLLADDGPLIQGVKQSLEVTFGNSPTTLAGLGITPRKKPAPLTVQVLATKTAKAAATRVARGTTSKKQKATVFGNVSGSTITPVVVAAESPATTPAASASPVVTASPAVASSGTPTHS